MQQNNDGEVRKRAKVSLFVKVITLVHWLRKKVAKKLQFNRAFCKTDKLTINLRSLRFDSAVDVTYLFFELKVTHQ